MVIPKGVDICLQEMVIYESELVIAYRGWLLQEMVAHGRLNVLLFIIAQYFIIIFHQNNGLWYSDSSWCHWQGKNDSSCHFRFDSLMVLFTRFLVTILSCVFQLPCWQCLDKRSNIKYFVLGYTVWGQLNSSTDMSFAFNH